MPLRNYNLFFVISLFGILLTSSSIVGQNNVTSRLRIVSGGTLTINFNSLGKYTSGITLNNWTTLDIYFNDTIAGGLPTPLPSGKGWQLMVSADQSTIVSDGVAPDLDLSSIVLDASIVGATTAVAKTGVILTNLKEELVSDLISVADVHQKILITYHILPMIGKPGGYFTVDLIFTLEQR